MQTIRVIWRFYVYSNLHIALGAVMLVMAGSNVAQESPNIKLLLAVFCATLISYNLHRYIGCRRMKRTINELPHRFQWFERRPNVLLTLLLLSMGILAWSILYLSIKTIVGLSLLGIGTMLYVLPVFAGGRRMRDYPFVKIAVISSVWAGLFCLPMVVAEMPFMHLLIFYLHCFLFFLGLTLPFDIRDVILDDLSDVQTLGNTRTLGESIIIITLLYVTSIILTLVLLYFNLVSIAWTTTMVLFLLLAWLLSTHKIGDRSELYFMGLLDGLIIGYGLIFIFT